MNTSYYFTVHNLERESDGYVYKAEWSYGGISTSPTTSTLNKGTVERGYGVAGVSTFARPSSLIPYADLTESQVIGWISTGIGTTSISDMKTEIDKHIDPNIGGTPW